MSALRTKGALFLVADDIPSQAYKKSQKKRNTFFSSTLAAPEMGTPRNIDFVWFKTLLVDRWE